MGKKGGRPTKFTPVLLDEILEFIRSGESERSIFRREGMPSWSNWCAYKQKHAEFQDQYARAKEIGYEVWEDEIIKIAEDQSRDQIPDGKGGFKSDNTAVNRDRLRIDTKKWLMSKLASKKYGDKTNVDLSSSDGTMGVVFIGSKEDPSKT